MKELTIELNQDYKQFKNILPNTFVWEEDDLFSNKINEIFYDFAVKRHDEKARLGMLNGGFNIEEIYKGKIYSKEKICEGIEIPKIKNKKDFWNKAKELPKEKFEAFEPLFKRINQLLEIN